MTERRGEVGMAEALRAAKVLSLEGQDEELGHLVQALGISVPRLRERAAPTMTGEPADQTERDASTPATAPVSKTSQADVLPTSAPSLVPPRRPVAAFIEELPPEPANVVAWDDALRPLQAPAGLPMIAYHPPSPPPRLRSAIVIMLRRPRLSARVDVHRLVEAMATFQRVREIPREVESALAWGATVVADVGPGMLPYVQDVEYLVGQVRLVVGEANVNVVWSEDAREAVIAPPDRTALVISSMGDSRSPLVLPGSARRWASLVAGLAKAGVDVMGLVPHRRTAQRWAVKSSPMRYVIAWDDLSAVSRGHT